MFDVAAISTLAVDAALYGFGPDGLPLVSETALTANRISLGLALGLSGWNKIRVPARHESLVETLRDAAGLPFPRQLSWFVCGSEFVFGSALVLGIGSGLAALVALALCCVASATVEVRYLSANMHPINRVDWVDDLFFIPANLFVIMSAIVLLVGDGIGII